MPVSAGVDGVLSSLVATLHDAMVAGTWSRLKACRNSHCRWAFYDHSRNSSGAWCSELACGSRMKVRAYRARQRAGRDVAAADAPPPSEDRSMRAVRAAAVFGVLVSAMAGVAACGSSSGGNGSTAPPAPKGTFCQVVLAWSNAGVGTVNHFSRVSPDAADVSARRRFYFQAWDGLDAISTWVDSAADRAPATVQAGLHTAADEIRATVATGRDAASKLAGTGVRVRVGPGRHAVRVQREDPRHRLPHARPAAERARRAGGAPGVRPPDRAGHAPGRHPAVMAGPARPSASWACVCWGLRPQASTSTSADGPGLHHAHRRPALPHLHLPVATPAALDRTLGLDRVVAVDRAVADGGVGRASSGSTPEHTCSATSASSVVIR